MQGDACDYLNPDDATLRRWAFDEDFCLIEQDEDLLLHDRRYLPVLIELAADPTCPKGEYILSILDYFLMLTILHRREQDIDTIEDAIMLAERTRSERLREWTRLQRRRLEYRRGIGPVDRAQALAMGEQLLNGVCRKADVSINGEDEQYWEVLLSVHPFHSHREWLVIDKVTGRFAHSRFGGPRRP